VSDELSVGTAETSRGEALGLSIGGGLDAFQVEDARVLVDLLSSGTDGEVLGIYGTYRVTDGTLSSSHYDWDSEETVWTPIELTDTQKTTLTAAVRKLAGVAVAA